MNFTHLHLHTSYSVLDGICKLDEVIPKAKSLGMKAIAITDHNHLGGTYQFQIICKENKIKPILGYEAYYTEDTSILALSSEERNKLALDEALKKKAITQDEYDAFYKKTTGTKIKKSDIVKKIEPFLYDTKQYHIIFLAMNQTGWKNIIKLQSESAEACTFNGRFLCDNKLIKKYNEGIICSTACIANRIAKYVNSDRENLAEVLLKEWHDIFKDRFYLEIQPLRMIEQIRANLFYIKMGAKYSIPLIATNDVHYVNKEDHDDHDTFLCIGTGKYKSDYNRMKYTNDFWLRSYDEMIEAFNDQYIFFEKHLPKNYLDIAKEALENTNKVADRIDENILIGSKVPLIPQVKLSEGETAEHSLATRCWKSLYELANKDKYVKDNLKVYENRLHEELDVINPKGFASYILVVEENVKWSNENGITTGPGRGSAAGSLCLYLLGITKYVDPIKNKLLFERFLTKDRTSPPDIDIDYMWSGRDKTIRHLEDYYGADHVAHIGTYTIMGVKSGLKDIGRVLEIPFETMNNITKEIDEIMDIPQPKFKDFDALKDGDCADPKAWERWHKLEEDNKEIFRLARKFEGLHRNFGVHASGVLTMPIPVNDLFPYRIADGVKVCLYTGPEIEELNCIKLDILGLKSLDIITNSLSHVDKELTLNKLIDKIDFKDKNLYNMLINKRTDAVFQLESDMFKGMISDVKPDSLEDITAITSLGRPGPLNAGLPQMYAKRKHGKEEAVPILRGMNGILAETYGLPIYQEMCMQIGVKAFGFNTNQSDSILRKIIGKKKKDKLEMLRRICKYGKINTKAPDNWHDNPNLPWFDEDKKMGPPISGGLANGYTSEELDNFWNILMGYASYAFNKSHACAYSVLSIVTAYLKYYYPVEFYAAVLSIQTDVDKVEKYIKVCNSEGIKVLAPDINISEHNFTPNAKKKTIYYGLDSIKGVGESVAEEIIKNRPYSSIQDIFNKLPKKIFNKRVALALAKSGALDGFETSANRCSIIDNIMEIRKEKNYEKLTSAYYSKIICMQYEKEILGAYITFKPWWDTIKAKQRIVENAKLIKKREKIDKNGKLMCFADLLINSCEVKSVIFSSTYAKSIGYFDENINYTLEFSVTGTKDDKGILVIKKISPVQKEIIQAPF